MSATSEARLVITLIEVQGRSPAEVTAAYGASRFRLYELLARYRAQGDAGFEPRSRRTRTSPAATPPPTVELVLRLRTQLAESGLDAGADTIGWHLTHHHATLSRASIHRILTRAGAVTPVRLTARGSSIRDTAAQLGTTKRTVSRRRASSGAARSRDCGRDRTSAAIRAGAALAARSPGRSNALVVRTSTSSSPEVC